jgi:flavin-dependent dehydrogenase
VSAPRRIAGDGFLLIGDSAGLARDVSGEGIGPAVESGALAADAVLEALGENVGVAAAADGYRRRVIGRFGSGEPHWLGTLRAWIPRGLVLGMGEAVCRSAWLRRRLVFEAAFGMG